MTLFISCATTTTYHGLDATGLVQMHSGRILETPLSEENQNEDIVCKTDSSGGLVFNGLWSSKVSLGEWSGTITMKDSTYSPVVNYHKEINENVSEYSTTYITRAWKAITVSDLPGYKIKEFSITKSLLPWEKKIHENEMPSKITSFSVDGNDFSLLMTGIEYVQGELGAPIAAPHTVFTMDDQIFQIMDDEGRLHAEFTKDSYRIFEVDPGFNPQRLWPGIAVFSVIRNICAE